MLFQLPVCYLSVLVVSFSILMLCYLLVYMHVICQLSAPILVHLFSSLELIYLFISTSREKEKAILRCARNSTDGMIIFNLSVLSDGIIIFSLSCLMA